MGYENTQCCYREKLGFALYSKFREPKLFRMAVTGTWDLIPLRAQSHPDEAKFVHKYPPADTALHRILRMHTTTEGEQLMEVKLEAVKALLEANPAAAGLADSFGRFPLHLACMNTSSGSEIACCLLRADIHIAEQLDIEQRTPMHFLVARNNLVPLALLRELVERCPESVYQRDIVDETPLDIVERRGSDIVNYAEVVETLKAVAIANNGK